MGKYSNIDDLIFSIFASSTWKAEKIQTFPSNFVKTKSLEEYIRVSIISSGLGVNFRSVSGELIIDIFSKSGTGPKQSSEIADKLDNYLSGKTIILLNGTSVQLFNSVIQDRGQDPDNPTLNRVVYSIPFSYSEVM